MDEKQMVELIAMFKGEARDHLAAINRDLLALERSAIDSDRQMLLEEIFRDAHSLKGAARAVGYAQVENISHHLESVFGAARRGQLTLTPAICDVLYEGLDIIEAILENSPTLVEEPVDADTYLGRLEMVRQGQSPPPRRRAAEPLPKKAIEPVSPPEEKVAERPPASVPPSGVKPDEILPGTVDETIRVSLSKVEDLMAQAGELLISKINADQTLADLKQLRLDLEQKHRELRKQTTLHARSSGQGERDALVTLVGEYQAQLGEFSLRLTALEKKLTGDTLRLGLVTNNLQDGIRRVRMLPFSTILGGFQRMVRDLARELGKDVALEVKGAEIELDKKVLEEIRDPLMHLLRNAVDHGLESGDEREVMGKARQGVINLTVAHQGNQISIHIQDDGRGIDPRAVRRAAVKSKVMDADTLDALSDEDILRLTLFPGVTTNTKVTGLSGRGIGLDVVRQKIDDLQGRIDIESERGMGTLFRLTVPVSLATTHGLLVRIGEEIYAIPLASVEKVIVVRVEDVHLVEGHEIISLDGHPLALVRLADILERPTATAELPDVAQAVVLWTGTTQIAFLVDELMGEQEMVVKSLGRQLAHVRNVAGATLLGTGRVVVILNPLDLIRSAQMATGRGLPAFAGQKEESGPLSSILIVDDSITTRTLEKNILEAAGYHIITAVDGQEALNVLRNDEFDLIVSDIQMPHMDGFELTSAIKSSTDFGHLPIILVTSLESQEDRRKGLQAGADAYIVKQAFDQEDLLATIKQLL